MTASTAAMAGDVAGTVYNAQGAPAANVQVSIAELGLEAVTGEDGTYRFADLAAGEHFVIARAEGTTAQRVPVNVTSSDDATRNIFLMSRVAVQNVIGMDADAWAAEALTADTAFAEAMDLADQMITEGHARGEIAWQWHDLEG